MALTPSKTAAALTGAWSALSIASFGAWTETHRLEPITHFVGFFAVAVVFFFVPAYLFVVGGDYMRQPKLNQSFAVSFKNVSVRVLCWFAGAAAMALPLMPFLSWLRAV